MPPAGSRSGRRGWCRRRRLRRLEEEERLPGAGNQVELVVESGRPAATRACAGPSDRSARAPFQVSDVNQVEGAVAVNVQRRRLRMGWSRSSRSASTEPKSAVTRIDLVEHQTGFHVHHVEPVASPVQPFPVESAAEDRHVVVFGSLGRGGSCCRSWPCRPSPVPSAGLDQVSPMSGSDAVANQGVRSRVGDLPEDRGPVARAGRIARGVQALGALKVPGRRSFRRGPTSSSGCVTSSAK